MRPVGKIRQSFLGRVGGRKNRVVCVADPAVSEALLDAWRKLPGGEMACRIGRVTGAGNGTVALCGRFGGRRKLIVPDGELLPRIC